MWMVVTSSLQLNIIPAVNGLSIFTQQSTQYSKRYEEIPILTPSLINNDCNRDTYSYIYSIKPSILRHSGSQTLVLHIQPCLMNYLTMMCLGPFPLKVCVCGGGGGGEERKIIINSTPLLPEIICNIMG